MRAFFAIRDAFFKRHLAARAPLYPERRLSIGDQNIKHGRVPCNSALQLSLCSTVIMRRRPPRTPHPALLVSFLNNAPRFSYRL